MLLKVYRRRHTKSDKLFSTQKHKDAKKDGSARVARAVSGVAPETCGRRARP
jgi:hypothetical protein